MASVVRKHDADHQLEPGMPLPALARSLGLPSTDLVPRLVPAPLRLEGGKVLSTPVRVGLPDAIQRALATIEIDLDAAPFVAPTSDCFRELGLHRTTNGAPA